ncbi:nitrogenase stabilizing/protective protein [Leptolyngbya sp. 'hensonii']|uniref:nitrogenase-stabilizing/protective protein NifW n=1 Tax=Leptolyngbya sp. 'hensonii' TaxID=1922337 RepID=UPI00094F4C08|nr:nitrogenase-stabilizing/protective protein NifW [Leptolyngbya sp. 'hensonii']OLP16668.1 nitrogenase stabilizing/protective protein [Leptolyngbya sp. 'hensonii']
MSKTLTEFNQLVEAEQYFEFFELPYDPQIVNVNRLHILQKFSNFLKERRAEIADLSEAETLDMYREALQRAYTVFLSSNSLEQKLFKVFNDKPQNVVLLNDIGVD